MIIYNKINELHNDKSSTTYLQLSVETDLFKIKCGNFNLILIVTLNVS